MIELIKDLQLTPEQAAQRIDKIKQLSERYLFRGYAEGDYAHLGWVYGDLVTPLQPEYNRVCIRSNSLIRDGRLAGAEQIYVDPDSVGMFAFNYKDITFFEGDIFHVKSPWEDLDYGYIIWNNDRSSFYIKNGEKYYRPVDKVIDSISYLSHLVRFGISKSGNIYERKHYEHR